MVWKLKSIVEARITLSVSLLVLGLAYLVQTHEPAPYKNVELRRYEVVGGELEIVATFKKTGCTFKRLQIIAATAGETEFLTWRDLDGLSSSHDRNAGEQTMRLAIKLEREGYDWIEIRTRHDCLGGIVDRVFLHLDNVP